MILFRFALGEDAADRPDELPFAERLGNGCRGSGLEREVEQWSVRVAGERDDRHVPLAQNAAGGLDAVEARKDEVEQDQIGPVVSGELDRLETVARVCADVEAGVLENHAKVSPHDRVVLHGHDFRRCEY